MNIYLLALKPELVELFHPQLNNLPSQFLSNDGFKCF